MSKGLLFWILMILWFIFGLWGAFGESRWIYYPAINVVLLFVLFVLLGWKVFGPPVQG